MVLPEGNSRKVVWKKTPHKSGQSGDTKEKDKTLQPFAVRWFGVQIKKTLFFFFSGAETAVLLNLLYECVLSKLDMLALHYPFLLGKHPSLSLSQSMRCWCGSPPTPTIHLTTIQMSIFQVSTRLTPEETGQICGFSQNMRKMSFSFPGGFWDSSREA